MLIASFLSVGQTTIQLGGAGTVNSFDNPICNLDNYSYTQQLYTAAEINAQIVGCVGNDITAIELDYRGAAGAVNFNNWTIYIGHTTQTEFSSNTDWMLVSNMTQVFNGITAIPSSTGWFEIVFDTPFTWDGTSNIVIAVDENSPGHNSAAGFRSYATTNSALRSMGMTNIDPNSAVSTYPSKSRFNNKPIIRMTFAGGGSSENTATGISGGTTQCVAGATVDLEVQGVLPAWSPNWEWFESTCESTVIGTDATIQVTPSSTTSYFVRPAGDAGCGPANCISTQVVVSASGSPDVTITPSATSVCPGGTVTLTASSSQTVDYEWSTGESSTVISVGSGTFTVEVENADGCIASTDITIDEGIGLNPVVTIEDVEDLCVGDGAVTLVGTPSGGDFTGSFVSGNQFTPSTPGDFSITYGYTDGNGCAGSASTTIRVTECSNNASLNSIIKSSVNLYPNPSSGQLNIEVDKSMSGITMQIIDMTGQEIYRQLIASTKTSISLESIANGIYFVKLNGDNSTQTLRWIKK